MKELFIIGLLVLGGARTASAAAGGEADAMRFASGTRRVSLVELFTSEGCSSCPPAERRLAALRDDPGLWRDFVPLAFHVDYWDRLGWRDRFASRASTAREYAYAEAGRSESVYTPCFVRNGAEARGASVPALTAPGETAGVLAVTYRDGTVQASFAPADEIATPRSAKEYEVHAAVLGGGIVSAVKAGENRGATLAHEFVVLRMAGGDLASPLSIAVPDVEGVRRHALAVWITRHGEMTPVQATGGWLD